MKEKFLLYIDILGFSELVNKNSKSIKKIYEVVNQLNVHKHDAFQTIIFSDTILVYNKLETNTLHDKEYVVMFMVEFVQDLLFSGKSINLNFRAIITYGEFEHYKLKNTECYFGKSLVSAYMKEKEINGVGLFIDNDLVGFNKIFKTCKYNSKLKFVYLFQRMLRLKDYTEEVLPLPKEFIEDTNEFWLLKDEIKILKKYFDELNNNEEPRVRAKYLQTYQFYRKLMPTIFDQLERTNFSISTINPNANWDELKEYDE